MSIDFFQNNSIEKKSALFIMGAIMFTMLQSLGKYDVYRNQYP